MTPPRLSWLVALLTLTVAVLAVGSAEASAVLDNGVILLGVNDEGQLNVQAGLPSAGTGTTVVGLRYQPTGMEATAPGCLCEGWGASYDGSTSGWANEAYGGASGMSLVSFTNPSVSQATSIVRIGNLRVTHDYHPSGDPRLFEGTVTLENAGLLPMNDVRYRRVMDWDVEPTAFSEHVTIWGGSPPAANLLFSSDDGFAIPDPLSPYSAIIATGPPFGANFVDSGPTDHGAFFEFGFGSLAPGARRTFQIYYGAGETEADANAALAAVNAEVWSFGQTSFDPFGGSPNTFIFAFAGVGGHEDPCSGYVKRGRAATVLGTHEDVGGTGLVGPGSFYVHDSNLVATATSLSTSDTVAGYSGPLLYADALHNAIDLEPCAAQAYTRAARVETGPAISAGPLVARAVESFSRTTCAGSHGWSSVAYLAFGSVVLVDGSTAVAPNTVFSVGAVTVIVNEQTPLPHGLEVNTVRVIAPGVADVKIGHAASEIEPCGGTPPCERPPCREPPCPSLATPFGFAPCVPVCDVTGPRTCVVPKPEVCATGVIDCSFAIDRLVVTPGGFRLAAPRIAPTN